MLTRMALLMLLALGLAVAAPAMVAAQTPPARPPAAGPGSGGRSTPQKPATPAKAGDAANSPEGVRQAIAAYEKTLAEGDAQKIAKFWTAEGDYAGPSGKVVNARQALASGSIDQDGPRLTLKTESLRMVSPEVAQEDGVCEAKLEGEKPIYRGRYSAVWVRHQGAWLLSSLRENIAPPSSGADRLAALNWLIGEWTADDDGATITVTGNWIDNKVYLLREIVVEREGRVIRRVNQRIAWEPLTRRLKAWTFDADGSLGESIWIREGDRWVVQNWGVLRDGQSTSARNTYSDITPDGFTLRSVDALVGSGSRPDLELQFKRVNAE